MCRMKDKWDYLEWDYLRDGTGSQGRGKGSWLLHLPFPAEQDLESC